MTTETRQAGLTNDDAPRLDDPDGWQDPDTLEILYCQRYWTAKKLAQHYDNLSDEPVTYGKVTHRLQRHGVTRGDGQREATNGLARTLEAADPDDLGGGR